MGTPHRIAYDLGKVAVGEDPGDAASFDLNARGLVFFPLVSGASGETRTLGNAHQSGVFVTLGFQTDGGGDITLTVSDGYTAQASGDETITIGAAGDYVTFVSIDVGANVRWRLVGNAGTTASESFGAATFTTIEATTGYTLNVLGTSGFDMSGVADALILDADGDTTLSAPTDDQLDVEVGAADVVTITNPSAGEHAYVKLQSPAKLDDRENWYFFDDFNQKALDETNENWVLNAGTDAAALDPAIVIAEGGTIFCDAGIGDGTDTEDASQITLAIPVQADSGGLVFEARLNIEDITGCSVNFGLTDVTTREEPFSGATATITSVATNAVCFLFDDGLTSKTWHMAGVDGDTDATTNGTLTTAPANGVFQVLRCEIDADGEGAEFFIDGTSVGSLTASVCAASTDLFLTAIIVGDGGNVGAVGMTIDYMYVGRTR